MKLHELIITAAVMWILAWMFMQGLEKQEFVDQARQAKHFESINPPPAVPTGLTPNYGSPSEPKVRYFQDASRGRKGE
jgi:hypothetical protein